MANIISFNFKTDAPWSEEELDNLNSALAEVVQDMDDDHVPGSFDTNITDEDDNAKKSQVSDEQKQEIISEFLESATVSVSISVDGENMLQGDVG